MLSHGLYSSNYTQQDNSFDFFFSFKSIGGVVGYWNAALVCDTRPMIDPEFSELVRFVFESLANELQYSLKCTKDKDDLTISAT